MHLNDVHHAESFLKLRGFVHVCSYTVLSKSFHRTVKANYPLPDKIEDKITAQEIFRATNLKNLTSEF